MVKARDNFFSIGRGESFLVLGQMSISKSDHAMSAGRDNLETSAGSQTLIRLRIHKIAIFCLVYRKCDHARVANAAWLAYGLPIKWRRGIVLAQQRRLDASAIADSRYRRGFVFSKWRRLGASH